MNEVEEAKKRVWRDIVMKRYAQTKEEVDKWAENFEKDLEAYVQARIARIAGQPDEEAILEDADDAPRDLPRPRYPYAVYRDDVLWARFANRADAEALVRGYNNKKPGHGGSAWLAEERDAQEDKP